MLGAPGIAVSFWVAPRKQQSSAAEHADNWINGDLVPLDDGSFCSDRLRRNGSNLFV